MSGLRVPLEGLVEGEVKLSGDASRYVVKVHRLGVGDRFVAFDPDARLEADAEVVAAGKRTMVALSMLRPASHVAARTITLLQALSKGTKVEAVVRDATELGATEVVVVAAARSVKRGGDPSRWRRVAIEAARQCGRGDVPTLTGPMPLEEAWHRPEAVKLMLDGDGEPFPVIDDAASVALAVGPEGGFSPEEKAAAQAEGFRLTRLGPFVMRTETACAAALGAIHR